MIFNPATLWLALPGASIVAGGVRWLYRKVRNREVVDSFVYDVATNHLPHIYDAQRQMVGGINDILEHIGSDKQVELVEPPPVQFIDFKKFDHHNEGK